MAPTKSGVPKQDVRVGVQKRELHRARQSYLTAVRHTPFQLCPDRVRRGYEGGASVEVDLNIGVRTSASIFDVGGRVVRVLFGERALEAGRHTVVWDGRDAAGRPVVGGVYFLRVATPGGDEVRRVVVAR